MKSITTAFVYFAVHVFAVLMAATTPPDLEQIIQKINAVDAQSPQLFSDGIRGQGAELITNWSEVKDFELHSFISKLAYNAEANYKQEQLEVANQQQELLHSLLNAAQPYLNGWSENALVDVAKVDFYRWIYSREPSYKVTAANGFMQAEQLAFEKAKLQPPQSNQYLASHVVESNAKKAQPLTPKQVALASEISFSAYQHISMYEEALLIRAKHKATQEELVGLAKEGLNTYHAANQRIRPNTLDRAYHGILMHLEDVLDYQHYQQFEAESEEARRTAGLPKQIPTKSPWQALQEAVEAGQMDVAMHELDQFQAFAIKRFDIPAYTERLSMDAYRQRCPKSDHPILNKLREYDAERLRIYDQVMCDLQKQSLMDQGKWNGDE